MVDVDERVVGDEDGGGGYCDVFRVEFWCCGGGGGGGGGYGGWVWDVEGRRGEEMVMI